MSEKYFPPQYNSKKVFSQKEFEKALKKIEELAAETETNKYGPHREFEILKDCGLLQIVLPGNILDFNKPNTSHLLKILKDIGKANLSVGRIYEGHINTLYLIHLYASKAQKSKWYKGVVENGDLFGVWNTQDQHGTSLLISKDGIELKGFKTFCSGATIVNKALITAHIKQKNIDGWQMAIINMEKLADDQIDFDSWKPLGMKASGSYRVNFTGYKLSKNNLLGNTGEYFKDPYFSGGAIRFTAVQLGGAEAIGYGTLDYLKNLKRTSDQIQQLRLSKIMTSITAGNLWINQAGQYYDKLIDGKNNHQELLAFANMTRTAIEEICLEVMEESNRCIGARGLMEPHAFGRIVRDLTFYLRQPAPDATRLAIAEYFINQ